MHCDSALRSRTEDAYAYPMLVHYNLISKGGCFAPQEFAEAVMDVGTD